MGNIAGIKRRSPGVYPSGSGNGNGNGNTGPTGPSNGPTGATGATGPGGSDPIVVANLSALTLTPGGAGLAAIVEGYYTPGDGGGGTFSWSSTVSSGDNILVVVPDSGPSGGWVRTYSGAINVKWAGAYGDGIHDDTTALQNVFNVAPAGTLSSDTISVFMPGGTYVVTAAPNRPALNIARPTQLFGQGGTGETTQATRIHCNGVPPTTGGSCALCIEGADSVAAGSTVDNVLIDSPSGNLQDGIVVHAASVILTNCSVLDVWRYGYVISSGSTGTGADATALGASAIPGNDVSADFCRVVDDFAEACGSIVPTLGGGATVVGVQVTAPFTQPAIGSSVEVQVNTTVPLSWDAQGSPVGIVQVGAFETNMYEIGSIVDETHIILTNVSSYDAGLNPVAVGSTVAAGLYFNVGAGLIVYGADGNSCYVQGFNNATCCNGTHNETDGAAVFIACYCQDTYYPHIDASPGVNMYIGCNQESGAEAILTLSAEPLIVGGNVAVDLKGGSANYASRLSSTQSNVTFAQVGADGATYRVTLVSPSNSSTNFFQRVPTSGLGQQWTFVYHNSESSAPWGGPYQQSEWVWFPPGYNGLPFSPLGWTDNQNQRGLGLTIVASPTMNSPLHFSWRQAVTLASGGNTVYLNGGTGGDSGAVPFLTDPTFIQMDGTVYYTGTGIQQAVTFTGTPTEALNPVEIVVQSGATTFNWYIGGGLQASGVAIASTVSLGATGITANFPAGTYTAGQTYSGYSMWGNAERKMRVDIEFPSAGLAAANCTVLGYAFVSEGSGTYNAAVQINNGAGSPVAVTLVWTYDVFVPNYAVASGNIG